MSNESIAYESTPMKSTLMRSALLLIPLLAIQAAGNSSYAEDLETQNENLRQILTASTIDGKILYEKFCASCHGIDGIPPESARELLTPVPLPLVGREFSYGNSIEQVEESIRDGRSKSMLAFKNMLSQEQIRQVANYVLELGRAR